MPLTAPAVLKSSVWSTRLSAGLIGLLAIGLTTCRSACASAVTQGLNLCTSTLLPSLFPFFVLSGLTIETGLAQRLGNLFARPMAYFFQRPGTSAALFFLGALGGYPTGARAVVQLYQQGQCSRSDAERMLALCNNCGPGFFLGVVGGMLLDSTAAGFALWIIHLITALLCALPFRNRTFVGTIPPASPKPKHLPQALTASVSAAVQSTLGVCGFVLFFSVLLCLLQESGLLPLLSSFPTRLFGSKAFGQALTAGLFEISCGVTALAGCTVSHPLKGAAAAFLLSFGGCSVLFQTMQQTENTDLSLRLVIKEKSLQALLAAVTAYLYLSVSKNNISLSIAFLHHVNPFFCFSVSALLLLFCFFALVKARKKRYNTK